MPSWRRLDLHVGAQHVPFVAHGLDELRVAGIFLELLPHAAYLKVDRTLERIRIASLGQVEQLVATEHTLRMLEKDLEQAKLRECQDYYELMDVDAMRLGQIECRSF